MSTPKFGQGVLSSRSAEERALILTLSREPGCLERIDPVQRAEKSTRTFCKLPLKPDAGELEKKRGFSLGVLKDGEPGPLRIVQRLVPVSAHTLAYRIPAEPEELTVETNKISVLQAVQSAFREDEYYPLMAE